mmetsp:Transcript_2119/g.3879  ORF Transcript_2119/g.3879 Transcript_2119/m.3879 type:complete len:269 (+) Transcript_2119:579-1385(+)
MRRQDILRYNLDGLGRAQGVRHRQAGELHPFHVPPTEIAFLVHRQHDLASCQHRYTADRNKDRLDANQDRIEQQTLLTDLVVLDSIMGVLATDVVDMRHAVSASYSVPALVCVRADRHFVLPLSQSHHLCAVLGHADTARELSRARGDGYRSAQVRLDFFFVFVAVVLFGPRCVLLHHAAHKTAGHLFLPLLLLLLILVLFLCAPLHHLSDHLLLPLLLPLLLHLRPHHTLLLFLQNLQPLLHCLPNRYRVCLHLQPRPIHPPADHHH